jgi:hypothetical protein
VGELTVARRVVRDKKSDSHAYDCLAPPKPRRRKREARRWLDLLAVFTTNGLPRNRWPGQRLLDPRDGFVIRDEAMRRLERRDPDLFKAVEYVQWRANTVNLDISIEEWKVRAHRCVARIERLRVELRPLEKRVSSRAI